MFVCYYFLSEDLINALGFLPDMGVEMEVFSGGQPKKGTSNRRVGSVRHDDGNAADVFFYKDGRRLDWGKPEDLPIFEEIVRRSKKAGVTGFGAGPGYMRPGSMHIGFGTPAVWGAKGRGANAPDWLRNAYDGVEAGTRVAQSAPSPTGPEPTPHAAMAFAPEAKPANPLNAVFAKVLSGGGSPENVAESAAMALNAPQEPVPRPITRPAGVPAVQGGRAQTTSPVAETGGQDMSNINVVPMQTPVSADQIANREAMARALQRRAAGGRPIEHPLQGAAQLSDAVMAGLINRKAQSDRNNNNQMLAQALFGGGDGGGDGGGSGSGPSLNPDA